MQKKLLPFIVAFLFSIQAKAQNTVPPKSTIAAQPTVKRNYTITGAYETNADISPKSAITELPNAKAIFSIRDVNIADSVTVPTSGGTTYLKHRVRATISSIGAGFIKCQWVEKVIVTFGHPSVTIPFSSEFFVKINGTGSDFTEIVFEKGGYGSTPSMLSFVIKAPANLQSNEVLIN